MVLDTHALKKSNKIKGNHVSFLSEELSKAIMNRFKLRNTLQSGHPPKTS